MRNKFAGTCYRCGGVVPPGDGHFEKIRGTKRGWRVQHANCAIEHRNIKYEQQDQERQRIAEQNAIANIWLA